MPMSVFEKHLRSKLAVFKQAVRSQVTAARLAALDGNRTYAGRLLCHELARIKDRQQRPGWYSVAAELFELRCALETIGKKLRVAIA